MQEKTQINELLAFFKALADENRLKIVGILANHSHTVEELAELLTLSPSTTSHHLSRLSKAGLVSATADGHYYRYRLETQALHDLSQRLLSSETLPKIGEESQRLTFDEKVLATFTDSEGFITAFPKQEKKFAVLINYVLNAFEKGVDYTEKQINQILERYNVDTATLRRGLIDYGLLERSHDGSRYWRV